MKTIHSIILLIVLSVLATSCDICRSRVVARVKFTEEQKQWVPYKKGAVIKFTDNNGQPIDFKVTENKKDWFEQDMEFESRCADYVLFEKRHTVLESSANDFKITFWMNLNTKFSVNWDRLWDGSCSIYVNMNLIPQWKNYLDFELYATKEGVISSGKFHESLEINNHVYQDVIEISKTIEGTYNRQVPVQLFYAKDYGILQIKVDNENVLMLNHESFETL